MNLTDQQKKAASAGGSVVVTAGAGTGKTAMLAERFLHHVKSGSRPIEIVAVTFTEKAAAELRQRIRNIVSESGADEDIVAEVDASQISTIHALAARICRDFYDRVGISPDFRILLETDSQIWLANEFDNAMSFVPEDVITELGYSWLKEAIAQLLENPHAAFKALSLSSDAWKISIETASESACRDLVISDAWIEAKDFLPRCQGQPGDKLENYRTAALLSMQRIEAGDRSSNSFRVFEGFRSNSGTAANWNDGLKETRRILAGLRDRFRDPIFTLRFGNFDEAAILRIRSLQNAFHKVHSYLLERKKEDKVLDFNDLELYAHKILQDEAVRRHYERRWRAFLVDEVQDTNEIQGEILELLTGNAKVTMVGDIKQSIYGFRGADISVFQRARSSIIQKDGMTVELSETFRSHEALAKKMNETFAPLLGEMHQPLEAVRKESPHRGVPMTAAMLAADINASPDEIRVVEARYIADKIKGLVENETPVFDRHLQIVRPIQYRDIALLSRTWAAVEVYIEALSAEGIPAVNIGGGSLLDTREAKDAIAMLSFLAEPSDDIALAAVLRSPFFAVDDLTLFHMVRAKAKDDSWWTGLKAMKQLDTPRRSLEVLLKMRDKISPEALLREVDSATGYSAVIANLSQGDRRQADWLGVLSLLRDLNANGLDDLFGAVRRLRSLSLGKSKIARPSMDAGNAVTLTSIHNSKGLEWPVVFVPDLTAKPSGWGKKLLVDSEIGVAFEVEDENVKAKPAIYELIKRLAKLREFEEEKRLLYVAVTRARDQVILTSGPMKSGTAIELLMPGIEAAQISIEEIPFSKDRVVPRAPREAEEFPLPNFVLPGPMKIGLRSVTATGLTDFAVCPRKFEYKYIHGHPGLGEGEARRGRIGTLTHLALQLDLSTFDDLNRIGGEAPRDYITEALSLAETFRKNDIFHDFRTGELQKEVPIWLEYRGVNIRGVADLVGSNFVLDYKTTENSEPEAHQFQLWAYARALNKPRAIIAFLRSPAIFQFSPSALEHTESIVSDLLVNISAGNFEATPSQLACSYCPYQDICPDRIRQEVPAQLSLFG